MFHSVDGCAICQKWLQGSKWGWRANVPRPSSGPFARGPVSWEDGCPGPHLWLPGWVPHHRSVCHYANWKCIRMQVMCFSGMFAQTTITTSLILSCLALSEEFLCHTIHAAACWPQVSHIQQLHWFTDSQCRSFLCPTKVAQYIWDIILSCNSMESRPLCWLLTSLVPSQTVMTVKTQSAMHSLWTYKTLKCPNKMNKVCGH